MRDANRDPLTKAETMKTTYKGYEIFKSYTEADTWTIIDERGSGHVLSSLEECKAEIDGWK